MNNILNSNDNNKYNNFLNNIYYTSVKTKLCNN